jgi:MFS family permease
MIPNIQTILRSEYEGQDLAFAYGMIGAVGAVGAAVGPIVGGFFTTYFSWRWAFRTELLIVIIVLILSRSLRKDQLLEQRPRFDFLGAILSVLGWSTIVFGILLSQRYGLFLAKEPFVIGRFEIAPLGLSISSILLGIGAILIILLLAWERHQEATGADGLFKPSIFETPGITAGFATRFMQVGITAAFLYIFPLLLQLSFEFTAMQTGLALMPFSISMLVLAIVGARLSDRFFAHQIIRVGWIFATAGLGALGASIQPGATFTDLALGGLFGMGVGLIASQILNLILSSVDRQQTAETAGLSSTFEQLGNSIAVALVGTVMLTTLASGLAQGINDSAVLPEESKAPLVIAAEEGVQLMSDSQFEQGLEEVDADSAMADELQGIYGESRTAAFQAGVALLIFAALLGLVLTISLPKRKLVDIQEQEESAIPGAS